MPHPSQIHYSKPANMTNSTRPHKRQKTSHAYQSVMLMTTLSLMSQYSQDGTEARPAKRRRTNDHVAYTHSYEEMCVAEAMLGLGRGW